MPLPAVLLASFFACAAVAAAQQEASLEECNSAQALLFSPPCPGMPCPEGLVYYQPAHACAPCGTSGTFCCPWASAWACQSGLQCRTVPNPFDAYKDGTPYGLARICTGKKKGDHGTNSQSSESVADAARRDTDSCTEERAVELSRVDYPGIDYDEVFGVTLEGCKAACISDAHPDCTHAFFVPKKASAAKGACYMKNIDPTLLAVPKPHYLAYSVWIDCAILELPGDGTQSPREPLTVTFAPGNASTSGGTDDDTGDGFDPSDPVTVTFSPESPSPQDGGTETEGPEPVTVTFTSKAPDSTGAMPEAPGASSSAGEWETGARSVDACTEERGVELSNKDIPGIDIISLPKRSLDKCKRACVKQIDPPCTHAFFVPEHEGASKGDCYLKSIRLESEIIPRPHALPYALWLTCAA